MCTNEFGSEVTNKTHKLLAIEPLGTFFQYYRDIQNLVTIAVHVKLDENSVNAGGGEALLEYFLNKAS